MKELLETSMATRKNVRLSDIYDTLKYEDALRVTFIAFRLRGMAKDWWLRASEARALKNQPWTYNDFQEEFRKEYIPRGHWHPYHQWDLRQQLKPPQGRRWQIKWLCRGKQLLARLQPPGQGPWKYRDSKRSGGEQRIGSEGRRTLTPGGRTCGRHVLSDVEIMFLVWETRAYQGSVPRGAISTSETSRRVGRPPAVRGATE
ncbi:hypothetical protein M9H77_12207 [Catharanthus roseus]|uniref:Uncharacterized protein n=1 Tax=Catharanthus roseus TaxID=4058 RepID=A0ACC0BGY3_CATRO|nr:hypothetical protein M9H77_12207 [Catharanthus roseus]